MESENISGFVKIFNRKQEILKTFHQNIADRIGFTVWIWIPDIQNPEPSEYRTFNGQFMDGFMS